MFNAKPQFNPDPIIRAEVAASIDPFNPGGVFMEIATTIDPVIRVHSTTFTDDLFVMDGRELYLISDLRDMAVFVGVRAGQYFRSRMDETPPSNVELGEN